MRVTVEAIPDRPAWEVRADGRRAGVVFRERGKFRGIVEGQGSPLSNEFNSRDAAAKGVARRAGYSELDANVVEVTPKR